MKSVLTVVQSSTKIIHVTHGIVKDILNDVQLKTVPVENSVPEPIAKMNAVPETIAAGLSIQAMDMCQYVTES